jgi:hypothetical protein
LPNSLKNIEHPAELSVQIENNYSAPEPTKRWYGSTASSTYIVIIQSAFSIAICDASHGECLLMYVSRGSLQGRLVSCSSSPKIALHKVVQQPMASLAAATQRGSTLRQIMQAFLELMKGLRIECLRQTCEMIPSWCSMHYISRLVCNLTKLWNAEVFDLAVLPSNLLSVAAASSLIRV